MPVHGMQWLLRWLRVPMMKRLQSLGFTAPQWL